MNLTTLNVPDPLEVPVMLLAYKFSVYHNMPPFLLVTSVC